jgi:hypothetical protein
MQRPEYNVDEGSALGTECQLIPPPSARQRREGRAAELAVESFLPADAATAEALHQLAAAAK